jgi:hypothetical protein
LFAVACGDPPSEEEISSDTQLLAQCSFSVTKNVYDGPNWWGTITVKNTSATAVTGLSLSFDLPTGVRCDYAPSGWSYKQSGTTCTYTKASGTLAAGASISLNYSTTSTAFKAAANVKVTGSSCTSTGGTASGGSTDAGAATATDSGAAPVVPTVWRKANLTNFESYPDPGSEECLAYNGCTWAGQFSALSSKQPESWVKANNIVAVHSKDFAAYKLKTLRLRQGTKQIDVKVYDECADSDCSGCCTANSKTTGFLIDVEKYTMERFGTGDGIVEWACLDCK